MERSNFSSTHLRGEIMAIVTVGIDLAKNVFAVHCVDEVGKPALVRPEVPRAKLIELIANLAPWLIGMEACSGAHHCAREFAGSDAQVA
jgi:transposase